ncbi:MAG: hypothetical protein V4474_01025 [Patescibacteria group bacterium]
MQSWELGISQRMQRHGGSNKAPAKKQLYKSDLIEVEPRTTDTNPGDGRKHIYDGAYAAYQHHQSQQATV